MKVHYLGASLREGKSAKDDSPYSIAEVAYATPDDSSLKKDPDGKVRWVYTGYGFRVNTIALDPKCIDKFKDVQAGTEVTLQVEPVPQNPSRNQVIGVQ